MRFVKLFIRIRNLEKSKWFFLTTRSSEVDIANGMLLGADAYITKPFSNAELVAKVKMVLDNIHEEAG